MKRRYFFITVVVSVLLISLFSQPVWAKSQQRYRWEGAAIGLGVALLGSAIIHNNSNSGYGRHYSRPQHHPRYYRPYPMPRYRPRHYQGHRYRSCEYYDYEKFWVSPIFNRFWRPGYYDQYERWIPGRWKNRMVRPGHWEENRVCRSDE